jgi:hypothetical protein
VGYALIAAILFAVAFTVWGAFYVRHELRPGLVQDTRQPASRDQAAAAKDSGQ